jgi:serine protease Do
MYGLFMKEFIGISLALLLTTVCAQEVRLRSGGKIQAPLLKETVDSVVVDLGYDVLRVPRREIFSIQEVVTNQRTGSADNGGSLYTVLPPRQITTVEAAERYGPAVGVVKTAAGMGSGFLINTNGYLITNFHVIRGEKHISMTLFIKEDKILRRVVHKDVEIIATAPFHDLAVLHIKDFKANITPVVLEAGETLQVGETVFAIGNPLGLERTVTEGVLSQTHRNFGGILYLQVDAPVNSGNSGGPLFNACGQVIGVINMGVPSMEGLNFAIPARHLKYILDHVDAFAYDATSSESGFFYPDPPRRPGNFSKEQKETDYAE